MKCRKLLLFFLVIHSFNSISQVENRSVNFEFMWGNSLLTLADSVFTSKGKVEIETLKFYISNIELANGNEIVWKEANSFYLIDAAVPTSMKIELKTPSALLFSEVRFALGIDSLTNFSGAMGGDLDPTKGMYWTWQNGYINFKLEGKSPLCPTRNNKFQFHLGGYLFPFIATQNIVLKINQQEQIYISFDLQKLLESIDLSKKNQIMSPGNDSQNLSIQVASIFKIRAK